MQIPHPPTAANLKEAPLKWTGIQQSEGGCVKSTYLSRDEPMSLQNNFSFDAPQLKAQPQGQENRLAPSFRALMGYREIPVPTSPPSGTMPMQLSNHSCYISGTPKTEKNNSI